MKILDFSLIPVALCFLLVSVAGCVPSPPLCAPEDACAADDDDSAGDDDDSSVAADDDDSTPDPENPFGGSLHQGDYAGAWQLSYVGADDGVIFCTGSGELNITENGTLTGQGSCSLLLDGQPQQPQESISFTCLAEMTDVGNMNHGQLRHTMSYAPAEELEFLLDGSASQGMVDMAWAGVLQLPDGERSFAGHLNAEQLSR